MTERPILFSDPMVRAILAGTKTQTRRAIKPVPFAGWDLKCCSNGLAVFYKPGTETDTHTPLCMDFPCRYGRPGDRLWVREAWALIDKDYNPADLAKASALVYRADGLKVPNQRDPEIRATFADRCRMPLDAIKWRPSIHMPRIASRLDLEIVAVRVERLQAISRGDAMEEGCPFPNMASGPDPREWYSGLWNEINGAGSWDANPWVWVVEFRRVPS